MPAVGEMYIFLCKCMDCSRGFYYILLFKSHKIFSLRFKKKFQCDKVAKMHAIVKFETCFACHTSNTRGGGDF